MFSMFPKAKEGDFIKDLSTRNRSLGLVMDIDKKTYMMRVKFPKVGKDHWVMWKNHGHYKVV